MTQFKVISLSRGFLPIGNTKQLDKFIAECNSKNYRVISVVPINSSARTESIMVFYET